MKKDSLLLSDCVTFSITTKQKRRLCQNNRICRPATNKNADDNPTLQLLRTSTFAIAFTYTQII